MIPVAVFGAVLFAAILGWAVAVVVVLAALVQRAIHADDARLFEHRGELLGQALARVLELEATNQRLVGDMQHAATVRSAPMREGRPS